MLIGIKPTKFDNVGDTLIGSTMFGEVKEYVELIMMQISQEYRNKGIGKKLFFLIVDKAQEINTHYTYINISLKDL